MSPPKRARLIDVAQRAGVSQTAVSYILGKTRGGFSQETVQKVVTAARELGFRPNSMAQSLRRGRTRLVGLIGAADLDSATHVMSYQLELGASIEAKEHRMDIVRILESPAEVSEFSRTAQLIYSGLIEGAILQDPGANDEALRSLVESGALLVVIGNPHGLDVCSVDSDNLAVGRLATQHLIDLGHTTLAYIASPDVFRFGNERVEGFLEACANAGIPEQKATVLRADDSVSGGYQCMQRILSENPDVTGVCTVDDLMAQGAVTAAIEAGLSIPESISIVGCNNDYLYMTTPDFLTTIDLDFVALGALAASKLIHIIEGEPTPKRETLRDPRLIVRRSSGPPRSRS